MNAVFRAAVGSWVILGSILYSSAAGPAPKPNILLIVADDMGYSDAGCYGGEIQTPNLDRLARNGLRFTQFYNTARCWPSRASILTGYYAQQVRRDTLPGVQSGAAGTRPSWARLLPQMLQPLGYHSYHSGKWHVDGRVLDGGFEHSYSLNDHDRYFNPKQHQWDDQPLPPVAPDGGFYVTTEIANRAISMLRRHTSEHLGAPFFMFLAFTSPHFPLHALPEDIALYRNRYTNGWDALRQERYGRMRQFGIVNCPLSKLESETIPSWNLAETRLQEEIGLGEVGHAVPWASLTPQQSQFQPVKMAIHAAMVHRMDREIGRVLDQLVAMNAFEDTLVLFLSDNGASAEQIIRGDRHDPRLPPGSAGTFLSLGPGWSSAANTPLRLHKSWVHEGGISTPFIAHWPRGIRARNELRHSPAHLIDIAPTILQLAGGTWPGEFGGLAVPPPPGKSLLPVFRKDWSVRHDYFWWFHDGNRAIRVGDWKLVADHAKPWELFNISSDRAEQINLATRYPERVAGLDREWTRRLEEFRVLATREQPSR